LAHHSGLETVAYTALITAGFLSLRHARFSPLARTLVIPIFTAVALTRVEGVVLLAFIVVFQAVEARVRGEFSLREQLRLLLPGAIVWVAWFAWRYFYYGLP